MQLCSQCLLIEPSVVWWLAGWLPCTCVPRVFIERPLLAPTPPQPALFPAPPAPLSTLKGNPLVQYSKEVLEYVAPHQLRGAGDLPLWSKRFPTSSLSTATRKALGGKSDVALSDYRSWNPGMAIAGRDFKSGPGKEGWATKLAWAKYQRLWVEVLGEEYGVEMERINPEGRKGSHSRVEGASPAPPAKR